MKKLMAIAFYGLLCLPVTAQRLLAFPGAEGFGKYTTGGRGGKVYYVTRNDDCTDANLVEGTFRWACARETILRVQSFSKHAARYILRPS